MEEQTFRSRLVALMKKSRKAIRLYGSVERGQRDRSAEYKEAQAREWKTINGELLRLLSTALDYPNNRTLTSEIFAIRDRFHQEWTEAESELKKKQQALITAAQNSDFVKGAMLSADLVILKARSQAAQAAHHELNDVIRKSKVSLPTIELSDSQVVEKKQIPLKGAKVIPLRRNRAS